MSFRCTVVLLGALVTLSLAAPQNNFSGGVKSDVLPVKSDRDKYEVVAQESVRKNERNLRKDDDESLEEIQAKSAHYSYDSSITDTISDQTVQRQETREGLALKGMYAYSDGFYKREVHYVADDKGYRVVKEISTPIGDGPQEDPNGKADVSSSLSGSYSITADDIARPAYKKHPKKV
ncbi:uncharacterized protein LOC109413078 [Aedes albopictus]|uniref:Cuticle protein n=1 Tax=Aedes albopictus TaxID=7160 RepID=A0ABM1ZUJ9_AEDAL|nr:uncharacterized protein LOC109413078 [Aedes albopictus]XP_019548253.2 uncharacterized protein LOC109418505 [Aedes albopictus]KXJ70014.1 hypothetical protein RP20_CCG025138 [Aedes albopictus]